MAIVAGCGLVRPPAAVAGSFLQPAGHGQVIVTTRFERSDRYFDHSGKLIPVRNYRKLELQAWSEYGLSDATTLIFAPSVSDMRTSVPPTPVHRAMSIRNIYARVEAGARFRLYRSAESVFSVQATAGLGGKVGGGASFGLRQERNEFDIRFLYGRHIRIRDRSGFLDIQGGYRLRSGAANEWRADLTFGLQLHERWTLLLQSFNQLSGKRGLTPAKRSSKLQASLVYQLYRNWSLQAGVFTTVAARNARRDSGMIAAVWRSF
ncbi:MAG: hypothetical protein KDJ29_11895 [Hyphomicrobiales bacterium]|nr:hypothetical protein [Hyphomicrobiales bacterium]